MYHGRPSRLRSQYIIHSPFAMSRFRLCERAFERAFARAIAPLLAVALDNGLDLHFATGNPQIVL